ncbi:MAG: hypothetical protein ACO1OY_09590, partial [Ramlibacter sp.]
MELDDGDASAPVAPVWAVFGDLMSVLLGAFVLVLVGTLVVQMDLVANLQAEVEKRRIEEQRRMALEKALLHLGLQVRHQVHLHDQRAHQHQHESPEQHGH